MVSGRTKIVLHTKIIYCAVTMFPALAGLIKWKYRRDMNAARVNRGLRGYAAAMSSVGLAVPE